MFFYVSLYFHICACISNILFTRPSQVLLTLPYLKLRATTFSYSLYSILRFNLTKWSLGSPRAFPFTVIAFTLLFLYSSLLHDWRGLQELRALLATNGYIIGNFQNFNKFPLFLKKKESRRTEEIFFSFLYYSLLHDWRGLQKL